MQKAILTVFVFVCEIQTAFAVSTYTCSTFRPVSGSYPDIYPTGFNNQGQIAGAANSQSFFIDANGMNLPFTVPPVLSPSRYSVTSVNNLGQVAGFGLDSSTSISRNRGFISNPDGTYMLIDAPPNTPEQQFRGLMILSSNDNGDVSGMLPITNADGSTLVYSFIRDSAGFFTFFHPQPTTLAPYPNQLQSMNNSGAVVIGGRFSPATLRRPDGSETPLTYRGDLGFGTQFYGINNDGFIVGGQTRAFVLGPDGNAPSVYCPEVPDGFTPYAINDKREIAGAMSSYMGGAIVVAKPTGVQSGLLESNSSWSFSPSPVGQQGGSGIIYISSTGVADLGLSIAIGATNGTLNASDFRITDDTCTREPSLGTLPPGQFCAVSFTFRPTDTGARRANLVIFDDSPDGPHVIPLDGTGLGKGNLQFSNGGWTFDPQVLGETSGPGVIYVYNPGTDLINFSSIAMTGLNPSDFAIAMNTCGSALAPYTTCAVSFLFTPQAAGPRSAELVFSDDSGSGRQVVSLQGTGTQ